MRRHAARLVFVSVFVAAVLIVSCAKPYHDGGERYVFVATNISLPYWQEAQAGFLDAAKSLGVSDAFDPAQNIEGGARLLRGLIDQYGGRLDLALAAYNAGPGAVDKYHGVPPYAETRGYVRAILDDYRSAALRA